jgi:hypothetical protein
MKTILSSKLDQITYGVKNFIMIGSLVSKFIPDKHSDTGFLYIRLLLIVITIIIIYIRNKLDILFKY